MKIRSLSRKGFTIVELVIVIAVIAILAAVLIPTFSGIVAKANESNAMQACLNCFKALLYEEESKPDGAMRNGLVFEKDGYAYTNMRGQMYPLTKMGVQTTRDYFKSDDDVNGDSFIGTALLLGICSDNATGYTADAIYEMKCNTEYTIYSLDFENQTYYFWVGENLSIKDENGQPAELDGGIKAYNSAMVTGKGPTYSPWASVEDLENEMVKIITYLGVVVAVDCSDPKQCVFSSENEFYISINEDDPYASGKRITVPPTIIEPYEEPYEEPVINIYPAA